jgi:hypothetical protein
MGWRKLLLVATAVAVSFALALVCESLVFRSYLVSTPGLMVWALFHPNGSSGSFDFGFIGVSLPIDAICWLVILVGAYALIRKFRRGSGELD